MSWPKNSPQRDTDAAAGFEIADDFSPFKQRNDVFTRAFWDAGVRSKHSDAFFNSYRMEATPRRGAGFSQRDFALRNAAWLVSDVISDRNAATGEREGFQAPIRSDTPVAPDKLEIEDTAEMSAEIKQIAKFFGANLCGITDLDERFLYATRVDTRDMSEAPNTLPESLHTVIVLGHEMDKTLVKTYPSALAGAATGREYSHEASIVMQTAAYIRNLGYEAVASMNDTGLVIPYAIKAGLGEYGRNQMVLTPEYGPRLRFSKILTNMPLTHDVPKRPGFAKFCDICTACADACPVKALPFGAPEFGGENQSAIKGVKKWTSNAEKCFGFWAKLSSDCAICMRVCPFNRDFGKWRNRLWRALALSRFRKLALRLAKVPERLKPDTWWAAFRAR
ncbi:4Fe-4S dicluster domain-containing protein [Lentibacter algarum]|uniref:4Fe-4S double cluster binding domain-containing protein n=1 Tax=Lentibacter algarum TaxID=576131 RepID=UPI001C0A181D|nr:reductive dehalogenase domain-containing protein [Lentibacter algarum]MBU2982914.1 4Fe-4S dicluster domain-containing protein [Lentibacter algarum]